LPYLADGSTDPIARAVMETYVTRLTHEKYAAAYVKVVNSLRNMFKAKPDSPTLVNFLALVKWVDGPAAAKLSADIGMSAHAAALRTKLHFTQTLLNRTSAVPIIHDALQFNRVTLLKFFLNPRSAFAK
jgi:hypothetical protein